MAGGSTINSYSCGGSLGISSSFTIAIMVACCLAVCVDFGWVASRAEINNNYEIKMVTVN